VDYRAENHEMANGGELLPGQSVVQRLEASSDFLCGVSVVIATYSGEASVGAICLELFRFEDDQHHPIGQTIVSLRQVYDNSFVEVFCPPEQSSNGKEYLLRIFSTGTAPGAAPTIWLTNSKHRIPGHLHLSIGGHEKAAGLFAKVAFANPISDTPVPPSLEISPVSQCNLNCTHCISRETRKSFNRLPERIRNEIKQWAEAGHLKTAYTDFSGDILWADQRFGGELDLLTGLSIPFHLDTNGTHLTEDLADRLFQSRVTSINVSIDAGNDDTYRKIRRGAPALDHIFQNMEKLARKRIAMDRLDVPLSAAFVMMRSNIEELPAFIRRVYETGFDMVRTIHMQAYTADMEEESLWFAKGLFNRVREDAIAIAHDLGIHLSIDRPFEDIEDRVATSFCDLPWTGAYLLGNGDVLACCVPGLRMGNLNHQSMEDIWNGPEYQKLRQTVNSDNRPTTCRACPFHRKTNNPLSYTPGRDILYSGKPSVSGTSRRDC
jgi:radical SAM protein with 4Fe4S-binding SPASM domain